jgi:hypothetical protein
MEYVIWGRAPGSEYETLLVSESAGLDSEARALQVASELEAHHGCMATRVQCLEPLTHAGLARMTKAFGGR